MLLETFPISTFRESIRPPVLVRPSIHSERRFPKPSADAPMTSSSTPSTSVPAAVSVTPGINVVFVPPAVIVPFVTMAAVPSFGVNVATRLPAVFEVIEYRPVFVALEGTPLIEASEPVPPGESDEFAVNTVINCATASGSFVIAFRNLAESKTRRLADPAAAPTAPYEMPMSDSVRRPPLRPGTARVTIDRSSCSMRRTVPSPKRTPLLPSSLYAVSWPSVSRVLLNCVTKLSTAEFALLFAWLMATVTASVVVSFAVSVTPSMASVIVFDVEYRVGPPSIEYAAFCPIVVVPPTRPSAVIMFPVTSSNDVARAPELSLVIFRRSVNTSYVAVTPASELLMRVTRFVSESTEAS